MNLLADQRAVHNEAVVQRLKESLGQFIAFTAVKDKKGGYTVAVVQAQEGGYTPLHLLFYGEQCQMRDTASALNILAGTTPEKALRWVTDSMFVNQKKAARS